MIVLRLGNMIKGSKRPWALFHAGKVDPSDPPRRILNTGERAVKRFLFGVLVGFALAGFLQWRGAELLKAMGIGSERLCRIVGKMERVFGVPGESAKKTADKAGKKVADELSR